jgi:hypothetical protein
MQRRLQFDEAPSNELKEKTMTIKKILAAAATAAVLSVVGAASASADDSYGRDSDRYDTNHYQDNRDSRGDYGYRDSYDHRGWRHEHRRFADRDTIFRSLRFHHVRYVGDPYFVRGHYVVRSYDRFGRVNFVEINPYTGDVIGVIRL